MGYTRGRLGTDRLWRYMHKVVALGFKSVSTMLVGRALTIGALLLFQYGKAKKQ